MRQLWRRNQTPSEILHNLWSQFQLQRGMKTLLLSTWLCFYSICGFAGGSEISSHIANQIDPAKLATLGKREANRRIQRVVYWLHAAQTDGKKPTTVLNAAFKQAGYTNKLVVKLTKAALLRNLDIAEKLGCLDAAGLAETQPRRAYLRTTSDISSRATSGTLLHGDLKAVACATINVCSISSLIIQRPKVFSTNLECANTPTH
jgi:hypothetical protein